MRFDRFIPGLVLFGALVTTSGLVWAQTGTPAGTVPRTPDPVIVRPGGEANKSRFEYAPENQPGLRYEKPASEAEACGNELDITRDKVRSLESQVSSLEDEVRNLKARNDALTRAAAQAAGQ